MMQTVSNTAEIVTKRTKPSMMAVYRLKTGEIWQKTSKTTKLPYLDSKMDQGGQILPFLARSPFAGIELGTSRTVDGSPTFGPQSAVVLKSGLRMLQKPLDRENGKQRPQTVRFSFNCHNFFKNTLYIRRRPRSSLLSTSTRYVKPLLMSNSLPVLSVDTVSQDPLREGRNLPPGSIALAGIRLVQECTYAVFAWLAPSPRL
jgi:hypothetical protein